MSKFAERITNKPIIMRMKSFCVAILALMTLVACKKESQQPLTSVSVVNTRVEPSAPATEKKTPSYLEQRVNTIYSKVFAEYNTSGCELDVSFFIHFLPPFIQGNKGKFVAFESGTALGKTAQFTVSGFHRIHFESNLYEL